MLISDSHLLSSLVIQYVLLLIVPFGISVVIITTVRRMINL